MIDTNSLFSSLCLRSLTSQLLLLFSYPVMSDSLWPDGLQHTRPVCPSSPEVCPSSYLVASSHLIILCPLPLCPQSFPASRTFPMSQLFASDNQNTGVSASASVLPVSIQGWFPLRLPGFISLLTKELSGLFFSTTVWRHQLFGILPSLSSSSQNLSWPLGRS